MKVIWVSQENPTSAADALEKSIAKWRFFSYCTKTQFLEHFSDIISECGLCHLYSAEDCVNINGRCPLEEVDGPCCNNPLILDTYKAKRCKATLAEFHAAARKVFKKLRDLKKSLLVIELPQPKR